MEERTPPKEPERSFRGLYKNVKISVRTLDMVIIGGLALIVILLLFGISNSGYTVSFDSNGGTDVATISDMRYGDLIPEPVSPTREGYEFCGWYTDENCNHQWNFETMQVPESITLYAKWALKTE